MVKFAGSKALSSIKLEAPKVRNVTGITVLGGANMQSSVEILGA